MGVLSWFDKKFYAPLDRAGSVPLLGQLAWIVVPNLQDHPHVIEGQRVNAQSHSTAKARLTKMTDRHFTRRENKEELPILGFGLGETEEMIAYKAKRRLGVVVGVNGTVIGGLGKLPAHHEEERVVVAPLYDIATHDDPKGFSPMMAQRVRHLLYRQYFPMAAWTETRLPKPASACFVREGVLRFDRLQFAHRSPPGCRLVPLMLAPDPLALLHSMLWHYLHMPLRPELEELRQLIRDSAPDGLAPTSGEPS